MAPSPQLIERVKDSFFSHMSFRQEAELQQNPLPVWTPPSPSVMPSLATHTSASGPGMRLPYASQPLAAVSLRTQLLSTALFQKHLVETRQPRLQEGSIELLDSRGQLSSTPLCPVMKGLSFTCKPPNRNVSLRSRSLFFLKAEGLKTQVSLPTAHPDWKLSLPQRMDSKCTSQSGPRSLLPG